MKVLLVLAVLALLLLPVLLPIGVLLVGFFVGARREDEHFRDLDRREAAAADVLVTNLKSYPGAQTGSGLPPRLITGEVTIGSDAMKNWLSRWRKLFGGEMQSYVSMQTRARREARLRVIEQARAAGYNAVCNLRFNGVDIGGAADVSQQARRAAIVSVIASGTAYTWGSPESR